MLVVGWGILGLGGGVRCLEVGRVVLLLLCCCGGDVVIMGVE